jgi:inner membrane protease subunit 1
MLATLSVRGDWLLVLRSYRRGRGIQVGDVVTYHHPLFPGMGAIKRVGGMPGDLVCRDDKMGEGGRMIQVRIFFRKNNCQWFF